MKLLKYVAIVLIVLAIVAAVIHYKRESIAREIANTALSGQGLVATDLSIDTLGTDRITFSRLVLLQDDGTRYELHDVSFPLNFPSTHGNTISIGELLITPPETTDETPALSQMLQSFLALPESLPDTEVTLSHFSMQDFPPLQEMAWRSATDSQHLSFSIDAIAVSVEVRQESHDLHRAELGASKGDSGAVLSLALSISRTPDGLSIDGPVAMQLAPWLPLLHALGILPEDVVALNAGMTGSVSADLYDDANVPASLQGDLTVDDTLSATYVFSADSTDSTIEIRTTGPDRVAVQLAYPSLEWTAEIPQSRLLVSAAGFTDVPVSLDKLGCRSGILCEMHVSADDHAMAIGDMRIGNLQFAGTLEVLSAEQTRIAFAPDFELRLANVENAAFTVPSISVSLVSEAIVQLDDSGWRADVEKLEVLLDSVSDRDTLLASLPVSISSLRIDDSGQFAECGFELAARAASFRWNGVGLAAPGAAGKLLLDDGVLTTSLELSDAAGALSAHVDGRYEIAAGRGTLAVRDAGLQFDQQPLSARLLEWPYPWDLVSGAWAADLELEFAAVANGWNYDGTLTQGVKSLAGHYNEIVFSGLDADLSAHISSDKGITVSPSSLTLALLDVGIPIEQLGAEFAVDVSGQSLAVTSLSMTVLGGKIQADPFSYDLQQESTNIMLRPQSIQLQFMVDLAEFEDIELSGGISGMIPVTVSGKTITVTGGRLASDAPGGVIRYGAGASAEAVGNEGINLVARALGNFQFDSLTSDVDYTEAGDLKLQMRLSGINPDMDATQPVILNLGVENNVPQLLRSLQATRAIEDLLQRKSAE